MRLSVVGANVELNHGLGLVANRAKTQTPRPKVLFALSMPDRFGSLDSSLGPLTRFAPGRVVLRFVLALRVLFVELRNRFDDFTFFAFLVRHCETPIGATAWKSVTPVSFRKL